MRLPSLLAVAALATLLAAPAAVRAADPDFNPHFIISDQEMRNADAMDYSEIYFFLVSKGGLQRVTVKDPTDGKTKDAARLIYDAAQRYRVNPKYLLALIQKESSAVETLSPTARQLDWATGYAVCDSCRLTDPRVMKYRGFGAQVTSAADWMDWYLNRDHAAALVKPGETKAVDNAKVTPVNMATAALYAYTPHLHGNRLLWSIWNRWFGAGAESLNFPDGTLLRNAKTGGVAVMRGSKLCPIANRSVLATRYNAANIVDLNEYDFAALMEGKRGPAVRFPDFSLVRVEDGRIFLIAGDERRHISSMPAFRRLGYNPEEVIEASFADVADYATGAPLDEDSTPPSGNLVRDEAGALWFVTDEERRPFLDEATVSADFPARPVLAGDEAALAALPVGEPMRLVDGTLAKSASSPVVYAITGGEKRPIRDADSFLAFGYRWPRIVTVSQATLDLHPTGEILAFGEQPVTLGLVPAAQ